MRAYILGNGASVACGQQTGKDFFAWGLERVQLLNANDPPAIQNVRHGIRQGFEKVFATLGEIRGALKGDPSHIYWPIHAGKYRDCVHSDMSDPILKAELLKFLGEPNFSAVVEEVVAKAIDDNPYTYGTVARKRAKLLGRSAGNFLDDLEDLQRDMTSLASYEVAFPNLYDDFVGMLEPDALVINLNWDNLFEEACRRLRSLEPRHIYTYSGLCVRSDLPQGPLSLSKPHGSLEYLCCRSSADSGRSGCFRITVAPGIWNYSTMVSRDDYKCGYKCPYSANLLPFLHPYARVIRSRRAAPFVAAALEALKPFIVDIEEIVSIGYSFKVDAAGWIDEDLLPITLGKRIHPVSKNEATPKEILEIQKHTGSDIHPIKVDGFAGYLQESRRSGKLLP